ncbi:Protein ssh4 [Tilletia horrida]|nr:Protein ssh4 [Tilletia horrida]
MRSPSPDSLSLALSSSSSSPSSSTPPISTAPEIPSSPLQAQQLAQDALLSKKQQYASYRVDLLSEAQQDTIPSSLHLLSQDSAFMPQSHSRSSASGSSSSSISSGSSSSSSDSNSNSIGNSGAATLGKSSRDDTGSVHALLSSSSVSATSGSAPVLPLWASEKNVPITIPQQPLPPHKPRPQQYGYPSSAGRDPSRPSILDLINYQGDRSDARMGPSANRDGRLRMHPFLPPGRPQHRFGDDVPIFDPPASGGGGGDDGVRGPIGPGIGNGGGGDSLALLLPLLILLSSMLFFLLIFIILVLILRRRARIVLSDTSGPLDIGREEELEGHGGLDGVEARWLEGVEEAVARGYERAKEWVAVNPPASVSTDITMSQSVAIQEKGVSAWSFDPDYENNPSVFVVGRTELTFLADGQGMASEEGGGNCVMSNLPLPKLNEVYYWEVKMFNKPDSTNISIGLATKPYPCFRLPGWSKFSIGYFSQDGFKCHNYPFTAQSYGPAYVQGDVIGVGYRPRTGTVFFTRNGRKLEDAFVGLNRHNYFPCIGADGAAELHVNLGQAAFVFIEATVKKWGLAPSTGTLPPPPAYGMEHGSILIESGGQGSSRSQVTDVEDNSAAAAVANAAIERRNALRAQNNHPLPPPPPISPPNASSAASASSSASAGGSQSQAISTPSSSSRRHHRSRRPNTAVSNTSEDDHGSSPHNPPTPHELDISLHSLRSPVLAERRSSHGVGAGVIPSGRGAASLSMQSSQGQQGRRTSPGPPSYASIVQGGSSQSRHGSGRRGSSRSRRTSAASSSSHAGGGGGGVHRQSVDAADLFEAVGSSSTAHDASVFQGLVVDSSGDSRSAYSTVRRQGVGSRASEFANALLGMLSDRGLLTPMSAEQPTPRSPGDGPTPSGAGGASSATGTGAGVPREERNSYFPPMTPAQQRAVWDRERALLAEQQAAANAAVRPMLSRVASASSGLNNNNNNNNRGGGSSGAGVPTIRSTTASPSPARSPLEEEPESSSSAAVAASASNAD